MRMAEKYRLHPQTIFMIDSSIRKNVAFGVPDEEIDDEKVWQA